MNTIGVIIVDYRSDPLLDRALAALSVSVLSAALKIVVVENCPRKARLQLPQNLDLRFLPQKTNLGFGRAVNLARRHLQTPYFLILNPDLQLFPKTISILHDYLEKHPDVGAVVPKLIDPAGNLQYSARTFYDFLTIILRRTPLGGLFPDHPSLRRHLIMDWDHNSIREIDWALGACMMVREKAVGEEIFDPRFFLYFEDVDLCLRLKKEGWKVIYNPEALAVHEHRQESRKFFFSRTNVEHALSWVKFMIKHRGLSVIRRQSAGRTGI